MKEDASGVDVYDNEDGKMLGPHTLLCVHASGDCWVMESAPCIYSLVNGYIR